MPPRIEMSRSSFYDFIWTTPALKLATDLEITTTDLAELCRKFDIPRPPNGYWMKVQFNKAPPQAPLAPNSKGTGETVRIWGRSIPLVATAESSSEAEEGDRLVEVRSIKLRETHDSLHRVAAQILKEDIDRWKAQQKNPHAGRHRVYDPARHLEDTYRVYRALDALLRALEAVGGKVDARNEDEVTLLLDGQRIRFRVRWRLKKHTAKLPPDRLKWGVLGDKDYETILISTGNIVVIIEEYLEGVPKEWLESTTKRFDQSLSQIVGIFIKAAAVAAKKAADAEESRKRYEIEQARRAEKAERERVERERWSRFTTLSEQSAEADRLRRFVTRLKTLRCDNGLIIDEMSLGEWLSWAEAKIDQIDPLTAGVEDVFRSVSIAAKPPRIPWL